MIEEERGKRKRKKWMEDWLMKWEKISHSDIRAELKLEKEDWFNNLRMDQSMCLHLLSVMGPSITRENMLMRKSISATID